MEGPACADIEGQIVGDTPVVFCEVLLDVVAGTELGCLQVDLESVDLAEQEAGDGVAAAGDALLIRASGGEGEGAGGVRRCDGVELVPAEVGAGFEGVSATGVDDRVDELPDGGLIGGEGTGRRA